MKAKASECLKVMYRHIRAADSGEIQSSRYRTRCSSHAHRSRSVKIKMLFGHTIHNAGMS